MKAVFNFQKLEAWQKARQFVNLTYSVSKKLPKEELFGLTNQMRRSAVSIIANIAEGTSRSSSKDQANFTTIAYGSLMETVTHATVAFDQHFITADDFETLQNEAYSLAQVLSALRRAQLNR
jgi:four helix bundle protein